MSDNTRRILEEVAASPSVIAALTDRHGQVRRMSFPGSVNINSPIGRLRFLNPPTASALVDRVDSKRTEPRSPSPLVTNAAATATATAATAAPSSTPTSTPSPRPLSSTAASPRARVDDNHDGDDDRRGAQ
jgi:hypothetical protein